MKADRGVEGVRYLLAEYCHAFDSGDSQRWGDLFTSDAEFVVDKLGSLSTRSGVTTFIVAAMDALRAGGIGGLNHVTVNSLITLEGDRAGATSDFVLFGPAGDGFAAVALGRYTDEFAYSGARWLFTRRQISWFLGDCPPHLVALLSPVFA